MSRAGAGDDFRGVGWAFPIRAVDGASPDEPGGIALAELDRSIRESILLILGTARGERVMRPTFGCGIHDLVFEPNDTTTAARVSFAVRESLIDFEPRIEVVDLLVAPDPTNDGALLIELQYRVRATNTVFNLVYPFYLHEGGT